MNEDLLIRAIRERRAAIKPIIAGYLSGRYPDEWDEMYLYYKKGC